MSRKTTPPLGVMLVSLWLEANPDPTIEQIVERYASVNAAVERRRNAKMNVPPAWLYELGIYELWDQQCKP